jgi:hypothetical protein
MSQKRPTRVKRELRSLSSVWQRVVCCSEWCVAELSCVYVLVFVRVCVCVCARARACASESVFLSVCVVVLAVRALGLRRKRGKYMFHVDF